METLAAQSFRRLRLLAVVLAIAALFATPALADKGKKYFQQGRQTELHGDYDAALVLYEKALDAVPGNLQYKLAARRTRFQAAMVHIDRGHKLRNAGKLPEALQEFERAFAIDPSSDIAEQELRRTLAMIEKSSAQPSAPAVSPREQAEDEARQRLEQMEGPVELKPPSRVPITLHATNDSKVLFETIGKLAGINVLFDSDYQAKRITIDLTDVTLEQALDNLAILTKTLWKPLTTNTLLVYQDTKRRDLEPQVIKTFYLSNTIQPNEVTELAQAIRNLLDAMKVQQINSQNAIVVRDTPDKISIVEKLIADLDKAKPEVVIDVAVLQVTRDRSREIGLFPGAPGVQVPVAFTPRGVTTTTTPATGTTPGATTGTTTTTTTTAGAIPLSRLGRLATSDWSIVLPGATLNLLMSDTNTRLLQSPQVRASDGASAKLRIGSRVPVATGSFQPGIGGVGINPLVNTQFQYLDVGVILEITPRVHANREISLKMSIEISAVTSRVNIGGIDQPVIGQRTVQEEVRLKEGETNILGGILEEQKGTSLAGIPGVSQVPLLKYLFSSNRTTVSENEVLILLTPHIVRLPMITALNLRGIDVGTQTNISVRTRAAVQAPSAIYAGGGQTPPAPPPGTAAPGVIPGGGIGRPPGTALTPVPTVGPTPPGVTPPGPQPVPGATQPSQPPATGATQPGPPPATGVTPAPSTAKPAPTTEAGAQADAAAPAAVAPALRFGSAVYSQPVGSTFTVDVRIDSVQNIQSVPFQLYYDSKQLKLANILNGDFLGRDGQAIAVVQRVDDQNGVATITLTRPPGGAGVSGSGILATVSFQALAPGQSALNILRSAARDAAEQPVSLAATQTRVVIR